MEGNTLALLLSHAEAQFHSALRAHILPLSTTVNLSLAANIYRVEVPSILEHSVNTPHQHNTSSYRNPTQCATMQKLRERISKTSLPSLKSLRSSSSSTNTGSSDNLVQTQPVFQPGPPPPDPEPGLYHHVNLGTGGIIDRDAQSPIITSVGTTGTVDTVGVFFEISDSQCFAAHINAYITRPNSDDPAKKHYETSMQTTAQLRIDLVARLNREIRYGPKTERMQRTLVMTCARLSGQEPRAAEIVGKTVREWLGAVPQGGMGRVAMVGSCFIAGWPAGGSLVFQQEPGGDQWRPFTCDVVDPDWVFAIEERELEGSEETW